MPDPSQATDVATFIGLLRQLRVWAGQPSYRTLAKQLSRQAPARVVAQSTVADVFNPRRQRLDLDLVTAIVRALGLQDESVARWRVAAVSVHGGVAATSEPVVRQADPTPAQLPPDLADFTGRTRPAARLGELLTAGDTVVLTAVGGPGGIGKTSLAVHVGHQLLARYPDGQLYVNLRAGSRSPLPADEVLARFLRGMGVEATAIPAESDERGALYRSLLAGRRMLIVLDDVLDAAQVRPLLPGTGSSAVVITSRNRLAGLDGVHRVDLDVFGEAEAADLLGRILGRGAVAEDPAATVEVLRCCAGLPLAIRLAAGRLIAEPGWTMRTLADRLATLDNRLDELTVEDRAVRASLAIGYRRLPAEAARAFRLLGLWLGPDLDVRAAAALIDRTVPQTTELLWELTRVYLLDEVEGRYSFHDLVRAYAAEQARAHDDDDRSAATARLTTWYLLCVADALARITPRPLHVDLPDSVPGHAPIPFTDRPLALAWLDDERPNLLAAIDQAHADGHFTNAWMLPVSLTPYFQLRSLLSDWSHTCLIGLDAAEQAGDLTGQGRTRNGLGMALLAQLRYQESVDHLRRAADISRTSGDRRCEAAALANLGGVQLTIGHHEDAVATLGAAATLASQIGDLVTEATTHNNIGLVYAMRGRIDEAADSFQTALNLYQQAGERRLYGSTLSNLGQCRFHQGDYPAARTIYLEAIAIHREVGARNLEANDHLNLGDTHCANGQTSEGRDHWHQALAILDDIADPRADELRQHLANLTPDIRSIPQLGTR
ncbi:hypothetical protein Lfu02_78910 [Longispora fulva]|nr:hypothetical protein Lfu02_78910 [Longispora fulva]